MKQEEKSALTRARIMKAALAEFARAGYEGASLNAVCAEGHIAKGNLYHHFHDKDELYLACVETVFTSLSAELEKTKDLLSGTPEERLKAYFDQRLRFFAKNPLALGLFASARFTPPAHLSQEIAERRAGFTRLNLSILTSLLASVPLRKGLSTSSVVSDFSLWMDVFNLHFTPSRDHETAEEALQEHEAQCHRQLEILLYGVLERAS